ncbi:MAG TPA: hypothetical protein VGB47_15160 [Thermoanaerobaculia bacterium]
MSHKRRWSLLAFALFTATVFGSWGCCTVTCCETKPRNQLVIVLDGDKPSIDPIVVSKGAGHEIVWKLPAESTITHVAITPRDRSAPEQLPFERCESVAGACRIACEHGVCLSGRVNPSLFVPKSIYYDYIFQRPEAKASADPTIRIDP